jgi:hypothetical protein
MKKISRLLAALAIALAAAPLAFAQSVPAAAVAPAPAQSALAQKRDALVALTQEYWVNARAVNFKKQKRISYTARNAARYLASLADIDAVADSGDEGRAVVTAFLVPVIEYARIAKPGSPFVVAAAVAAKAHNFDAYVETWANADDIADLTPREAQDTAVPEWRTARLSSIAAAHARLRISHTATQEATRKVACAVAARHAANAASGNLSTDFEVWFDDKLKTLADDEAQKLLRAEIRALNRLPQSARRDALLTKYLTAFEVLKKIQ